MMNQKISDWVYSDATSKKKMIRGWEVDFWRRLKNANDNDLKKIVLTFIKAVSQRPFENVSAGMPSIMQNILTSGPMPCDLLKILVDESEGVEKIPITFEHFLDAFNYVEDAEESGKDFLRQYASGEIAWIEIVVKKINIYENDTSCEVEKKIDFSAEPPYDYNQRWQQLVITITQEFGSDLLTEKLHIYIP